MSCRGPLEPVVLSRGQQFVPVLGDGGGAGEVRLDDVDEPRFVGGDSVPVEEPLEIGEQKAVFAGQLDDAAVDRVQPPSELDRRDRDRPISRRPASLSPSLGS